MLDSYTVKNAVPSNWMAVKKIYFVRHGESNGNAGERVSSKTESLSPRGVIQAEKCAQRLKSIDFEKLYASDYTRAQQTAGAIATATTHTIETNSVFGEIVPPSSLVGMDDYCEAVLNYRKGRVENVENTDWKPEDGENYSEVLERILKAKKILEDDSAESVVVVSHGIYLSLFAATILLDATQPTKAWAKVAKILSLSNTAITLFTIEDGRWQLAIWNDHAHFAE